MMDSSLTDERWFQMTQAEREALDKALERKDIIWAALKPAIDRRDRVVFDRLKPLFMAETAVIFRLVHGVPN